MLLLQYKKDGSVFSKLAVSSNPKTASFFITFVCPVHEVRAAQMHQEQAEQESCDPHVSRCICSWNQSGECLSLKKRKYQFTLGLAFPAPIPPFSSPIQNNNSKQCHRDILFGQSALDAKGTLSIL